MTNPHTEKLGGVCQIQHIERTVSGNIHSLYAEWQKWMDYLGSCNEDMVQICYENLNAIEKAIIDKPALTAQDLAIKVIVSTNDGIFTLSQEFILSLKSIALKH